MYKRDLFGRIFIWQYPLGIGGCQLCLFIPIVGGLVSKAKKFPFQNKKEKSLKNNIANGNCNSIPADKVNLSPIAKDMLACSKQAHSRGNIGHVNRDISQVQGLNILNRL